MANKEFTQEWWRRTLNDDAKLVAWLQKLQRTEISGYDEHIVFMNNNLLTSREKLILTNIAEDERKHSDLLISLFEERKIPVVSDGQVSSYWEDMLKNTERFQDYCAANYFGEALAAFRFEVIHDMPETPSDIKEFISKALPDEIFHRETLQRLSGADALEEYRIRHEAAYKRLTEK